MSSEMIQDTKKQKKSKLAITVGAVIFLIILVWYIYSSQQEYTKPQREPEINLTGSTDSAKDSWISQSTSQLQRHERDLDQYRKEMEKMRQQLDKMAQEDQSPKKVSVTKPATTQAPPMPGKNSAFVSANMPFPGNQKQSISEKPMTGLIVMKKGKAVGAAGDKKALASAPSVSDQKKREILSAGSFVKVVLLSGVDAPTGAKGKGNPYPVLFRVTDLAQLPNKFRADIRECFVIGEAFGELSSERAMIRINALSCVNKEGSSVESSIQGYAVGEDGKQGLSGRVVTKQGAILARTMIAGFLQGVADAFSNSSTVVNVGTDGTVSTIDPSKVSQAGLASGASKAAEKLAEFYMDLAKDMFPVIEISAGRKVEVVFLQKVMLSEAK